MPLQTCFRPRHRPYKKNSAGPGTTRQIDHCGVVGICCRPMDFTIRSDIWMMAADLPPSVTPSMVIHPPLSPQRIPPSGPAPDSDHTEWAFRCSIVRHPRGACWRTDHKAGAGAEGPPRQRGLSRCIEAPVLDGLMFDCRGLCAPASSCFIWFFALMALPHVWHGWS